MMALATATTRTVTKLVQADEKTVTLTLTEDEAWFIRGLLYHSSGNGKWQSVARDLRRELNDVGFDPGGLEGADFYVDDQFQVVDVLDRPLTG
jgi:hypothetical protein